MSIIPVLGGGRDGGSLEPSDQEACWFDKLKLLCKSPAFYIEGEEWSSKHLTWTYVVHRNPHPATCVPRLRGMHVGVKGWGMTQGGCWSKGKELQQMATVKWTTLNFWKGKTHGLILSCGIQLPFPWNLLLKCLSVIKNAIPITMSSIKIIKMI